MTQADTILSTLGLALRAGRLEVGEEPVGAACRARTARLVLAADDSAPNTFRRAAHFAEIGGVPCVPLPFPKAALGSALGRSSCAMAAMTDPGMAASLMRKLAQSDPGRYAPAAQELDARAQAAARRRQEQQQHEKNLRRGQKRTQPPQGPKAPQPPRGEHGADRSAPRKDSRTGPGPHRQGSASGHKPRRKP